MNSYYPLWKQLNYLGLMGLVNDGITHFELRGFSDIYVDYHQKIHARASFIGMDSFSCRI